MGAAPLKADSSCNGKRVCQRTNEVQRLGAGLNVPYNSHLNVVVRALKPVIGPAQNALQGSPLWVGGPFRKESHNERRIRVRCSHAGMRAHKTSEKKSYT